ncbi:lysozyme inhibitor LprI family protein [Dickeya undicola]|uniref:lysozyme inhibitor LprI family protein n=1 Tax=Dickeya undicola TaxID=1577887 RepID=UPI003F2237F2
MKKKVSLLLLLFPLTGMTAAIDKNHSDIYQQYYAKMIGNVCNNLTNKDSEMGIYQCATLMKKDADAKLTARINEINQELSQLSDDDKEFIKSFKEDQLQWERYRNKRCKLRVANLEQDSPQYISETFLCQAVESYRRIEVLIDEPDRP